LRRLFGLNRFQLLGTPTRRLLDKQHGVVDCREQLPKAFFTE
jgi:hypothetical protein